MTTEALAHALGGRRSGANWMARCPAHEDKNPSLSIRDANGKSLLHCHAGCTQKDVIQAVKDLGLWDQERTIAPRIVATYDYADQRGELLYQIVRYEPKDFKQRRPDPCGGWIWRKSPEQVLYRLPEVLRAPIVFVVEGERDVETLREYGFVATTNAGGAKAPWLEGYTDSLRGREVILIPDNDAPGRRRAVEIARALQGKVSKLVFLELEGGAKDITEWFASGHSEVELVALVESDGVIR